MALVPSYALDDLGALPVELHGVLLKRFFLAVVQIPALVVLEQAVVVAVVALAKGTVARDASGGGLAVGEGALYSSGRHGGEGV